MPLDNKQKKIVAGAAVALVAGGAALYLLKKGSSKVDTHDDFSGPTPAAKQVPTSTKQTAPASPKLSPASAPTAGDLARQATYTQDYSFEGPATTKAVAKSAPEAAAAPADGRREFKGLMCSVVPAPGWSAASHPMPMPNIGMVEFSHPDFAEMRESGMAAAAPTILLSVEDVSTENVDAAEMMERSKMMATQQLAMLTNGMLRPNMLFEGKKSVGVFSHCLEYSQTLPPVLDMRVHILLVVKDGLAYSFQLIANPDHFQKYFNVYQTMAKSVLFHDDTSDAKDDFTKAWCVDNKLENGLFVKTHPSWTVASGTTTTTLTITTGSTSKPESLAIYKKEDAPELPGFSLISSKNVGGVLVELFKSGRKERKVLTCEENGFVMVAAPAKGDAVLLDDTMMVATLKSVAELPKGAASSSTFPTSRIFINHADGFQMPISKDGSVIVSKISEGSTIYSPVGIAALQAGGDAPTVTVRVGDPKTDESCAEDLASWKVKLRTESDGLIKEIQDTKLGGLPAITFTTQEMAEVGPGQSSEVKSTVVIAVKGGLSTLIRWEAPTGAHRKFERQMNELFREFSFL